MLTFFIYLFCLPVPQDMFDEVLQEITFSFPMYLNLQIRNTCVTEEINPLTFVYEFIGNNSEIISICAFRPWRTNSWYSNQCAVKCE